METSIAATFNGIAWCTVVEKIKKSRGFSLLPVLLPCVAGVVGGNERKRVEERKEKVGFFFKVGSGTL